MVYLTPAETERAEALRSAILDARLATTDVSAFASYNTTVDEALSASKRLAAATAKIETLIQGAYSASP